MVKMHKIIGFAPSLLQIVMNNQVEVPVRQSGGIYLKNMVAHSWRDPTYNLKHTPGKVMPFHIHEQDCAVLRDTIVDAASIISKKAAEGLRALVLDVKYGSGAFMKEFDEARDTAQLLVNTSKGMGISTAALVTNMDSPIGRAVGNALEVAESIACLRGEGAPDLVELGCRQMATALHDGSALDKFQQMLESQGVSQQSARQLCRGDPWSVLTKADHVESVPATATGYVSNIDAMTVAQVCLSLGAGRRKAADTVDHRVGVTLAVRPGERVQAGQAWAQRKEEDRDESLRLPGAASNKSR
ncbi:thymidine phosphorylase-like [Pollicipes pollicipes]|uniref:thymidine phosphorylase-like n=1 Tax=Pollicipes pollicipes TaxID=41117 RepID=UPI001884E886|nr:thymidine phosphorylase-like [Pollicipes pollicipes]